MTARVLIIDDADLDRVAAVLARFIPDNFEGVTPEEQESLERFSEAVDRRDFDEVEPGKVVYLPPASVTHLPSGEIVVPASLFPAPTIRAADGTPRPARSRR